MLILQTTINTSKRFLDYSNYEYALAHKKILQTYNNSAKVIQEKHYIIMKSKDDSEDVRINFNDNQIYMDKYKNSNDFAGYILLLKHIKGYTLSVEDETIHILIVDKNNHIIKEYKKANAIVASLLVTLLVITVIFSIMGIYINKMYTIKSLNDYYDKQITQQLKENNKSK